MSVLDVSRDLLERFPHAVQTARHGAAHAAAAYHYGWRVTEIELQDDGGSCYFEPAEALDPFVEERQRCTILLTAMYYAGEEGAWTDRIEVYQRLRGITRTNDELDRERRQCQYDAIQGKSHACAATPAPRIGRDDAGVSASDTR